MANNAPAASYDQGDSQPWGAPSDHGKVAFGNTAEGGYDSRDDMVGGTDNQWCDAANWSSYGDSAPTRDAAKWSTSGPLSQADLAS